MGPVTQQVSGEQKRVNSLHSLLAFAEEAKALQQQQKLKSNRSLVDKVASCQLPSPATQTLVALLPPPPTVAAELAVPHTISRRLWCVEGRRLQRRTTGHGATNLRILIRV